MDKNWIEIFINGYSFYLPADRIRDLNFIDNKLVNISNSTITMINTFSDRTSYPYVTCPSMRACTIQIDNYNSSIVSQNFTYVDNQINLNMLGQLGYTQLLVGLLTILVAMKLLWKK